MSTPPHLLCDGCGQLAGLPHISRRLQRLEWATRFRPLHIQSLLLGGIAPQSDEDFLYSPQSEFRGEARAILDAAQITWEGKLREATLAEFQKMGLALTHILECPLESGASPADAQAFLEKHLTAAVVRIRRSLRPKRVLLFSADLLPFAAKLHQIDLGCPVLPSPSGCYLSGERPSPGEIQALRSALVGANAPVV